MLFSNFKLKKPSHLTFNLSLPSKGNQCFFWWCYYKMLRKGLFTYLLFLCKWVILFTWSRSYSFLWLENPANTCTVHPEFAQEMQVVHMKHTVHSTCNLSYFSRSYLESLGTSMHILTTDLSVKEKTDSFNQAIATRPVPLAFRTSRNHGEVITPSSMC